MATRTAVMRQSGIDKDKTLGDLLNSFLNLALSEVGATAGSIMMVERALDGHSKVLRIKARLGPPRKHRREEPIFEIDGDGVSPLGIATHAVRTQKPVLCKDVNDDDKFRPSTAQSHFRSLMSVPIISHGTVYGVINADHEEVSHFGPNDLVRLSRIAKRVSGIIADRQSVLASLRETISKLTEEMGNGDIDATLKSMTDSIWRAMGADIVILYQYDQAANVFVLTKDGKPTISGTLRHPEHMQSKVYDTDVPYRIMEKGALFIHETKQDEPATILREKIVRSGDDRQRFAVREGVCSLASLPLECVSRDPARSTEPGAAREKVGLLFVNYRNPHTFSMDERDALESFAHAAAVAIVRARREEIARRKSTGLYYRIHEDAHRLLAANSRFVEANFNGSQQSCFVMSIDIRRSTDLMLKAVSPDSYVVFMTELEKRLRAVIRQNYGIIDKFTGDGLLAYFPQFLFKDSQMPGLFCLKAATECHAEFRNVYSMQRACFQVVLSGTGLGIGVDYGQVNMSIRGEELIAVGIPVVYACRLSSVPAGSTVFNEQAFGIVNLGCPPCLVYQDREVPLKNEGSCVGFDMKLNLSKARLVGPDWAALEELYITRKMPPLPDVPPVVRGSGSSQLGSAPKRKVSEGKGVPRGAAKKAHTV